LNGKKSFTEEEVKKYTMKLELNSWKLLHLLVWFTNET
jgi:hypothetical protein